MLRTNQIDAAVFVTILLLALSGTLYARAHNRVAAAYYAQMLSQAHDVEEVFISGNTYTVTNGVVSRSGATVAGPMAWRAQALAYQTMLARLDPLLAVPGTNPQALREKVEQLVDAQRQLSKAQKTAEESAAIANVYPISFLRSLAKLELARQSLIVNPTEYHARAYTDLLQQTVTARSKDLDTFTTTFIRTVPSNTAIAQFGGVISRNSELRTLFALQDDAWGVEQRVRNRIACVQGSTLACTNPPELPKTLPHIEAVPTDERTKEVSALWDMAYGTSSPRSSFALASSSCIAALPGPYKLTLGTRTIDGVPTRTLSLADDIYFIDTRTVQGPYLDYVRTTLDLNYSPVSPFTYYSCPLIGTDLGTVLALEHISTLSHAQRSTAVDHTFSEAMLMYQRRTAGLEYIVGDIVHVIHTDTSPSLRERINTTARQEFLAHSAFPTFFRIGASSDDILALLYVDTDTTERSLVQARKKAGYVTYSNIRARVPLYELAEDMTTYLRLENRLDTSTPSTTPSATHPR